MISVQHLIYKFSYDVANVDIIDFFDGDKVDFVKSSTFWLQSSCLWSLVEDITVGGLL